MTRRHIDHPEAFGSVEDALRLGWRLLQSSPEQASRQATVVLAAVPEHPEAKLILGAARARGGDLEGARAVLEPLATEQRRSAPVQLEWGLLLANCADLEGALRAVGRAVALQPKLPQAWLSLADLLTAAGRVEEANQAYAEHLRASEHDPELLLAADALCSGNLADAEGRLRGRLIAAPTDVAAMRMLAEVGIRLGRYGAAETLLQRAIELAPSFAGARHNYALVLYRQNRTIEALPVIERLVAEHPQSGVYRILLAAVLASTGSYDRAIDLYAGLLRRQPRETRLWLGYGHALRTAGRRNDAIAAYRACLALAPFLGEAWWSLANLKTGALDPADCDQMETMLVSPQLCNHDRFHLHYALARAFEDACAYDISWSHYAEGARLRRIEISYDADATTEQVSNVIAVATPAYLTHRAGHGSKDASPIFIVGLPRSGSTLIEQMLASHPLVEGTMELPEIPNLVRELSSSKLYHESLGELSPGSLVELGDTYLERCRIYRRSDRPFFIDKMPNNWLHVPLISLILPNAKIIDARRHPMATCFSAFKQHFARGQNYSYDLTELGRFYRDYHRLMEHLGLVLPGRVHRVDYEYMVQDTESVLRALLDYCGLEYHPNCLQFHENSRAVRTASSEQVRQPIFRDGLSHWRHYEKHLGPLRDALLPVGERRRWRS